MGVANASREERFEPPQPNFYRGVQWGAAALIALMFVGVVGQIAFAFAGAPLFLATGILTLGLIAPILMLTVSAPPVTLDDAGLTLHPAIWRARRVTWTAISAIKPNPLLAPRDTETGRRAMVGRNRYRAAEGVLLVVPSLPFPYRIVGAFAGEGWTGAVTLNSRTHMGYARLIERVESNWVVKPVEV